MDRTTEETLYAQANTRVWEIFPADTEEYSRYFCLSDWPNWEEHLHWLVDAPEDDIREWVVEGEHWETDEHGGE